MIFKNTNLYTRALGLAVVGFALTSCVPESGVITGSSSSTDNSSSSIQVTKFQNVLAANWNLESGTNAVQTNTATVTFDGTCSRGIDTIKLKYKPQASGTYTTHASTASCTSQSFSWSGLTLPSDDTYDFQIYGVNGTGTELTDSAFTKKIKFDSTPPTDPTAITVNGTAIANGGSITLTSTQTASVVGTISNDTKTVSVTTGCSGGTLNASDYTGIGSFTYTISISAGSSCVLTFRSQDSLSNSSGTYAVTVSYSAPLATTGAPINMLTGASFAPATSGSVTMTRAGIGSIGSPVTTSGTETMATGAAPYLGLME